MVYDSEILKEKYDSIAEEEDRQEKTFSFRTAIPRHFIKKYIKATDVVLDAGAGTGINSIMMADLCSHVTLLDISPRILELASNNIMQSKKGTKIDVIQGDVVHLNMFDDETFSFVVCVGDALSYTLEKRFQTIAELVRVAKPGSVLIFGCDSQLGFIRTNLIKGNLDEAINILRHHETDCGMGPRTYTYSVDEMKKLLEQHDCDVLEIVGTPTLTEHIDLNLFKDRMADLEKLEIELCIRKELLGLGNHLLFIAKKR